MPECPNKISGWGSNKVKGVVIHYTVSETAKSALNTFMNPASKASAHVIIDHNGYCFSPVSIEDRAFHAGVSSWGGRSNCNNFMLGIELVNVGPVTVKKDTSGKTIYVTPYGDKFDGEQAYDIDTAKNWEIYYEAQIRGLTETLKLWQKKFKFSSSWIVGHNMISPGRKLDPGPVFPWNQIAENFFLESDDPLDAPKALQSHLERLGYELGDIDGLVGKLTKKALTECIVEYGLFEKIKASVEYEGGLVGKIVDMRTVNNILREIPYAKKTL